MPRLSQAEIRNNAIAFVHEWKDETSERAESQTFWNEFFQVFGLRRRDVAVFEKSVQRPAGKFGKIDLFWKGIVLAEHKSAGENLDKATSQAFEYLESVAEADRPQFVLISDFAHFRLYDLESNAEYAFDLATLPDRTPLFGFISGYQKREFKEQDPVNIKAALKLGALHDALADAGYRGHKLEAFLVRLVYCLFADDTGIFTPRESLLRFLNQKTAADGSNVGAMLGMLFQVLDTPDNERAATLDEDLHAFQYVNGALFRDRHDMPSFDARMRKLLIDACETDWSKVSPAIFGSLFQSVMDKDKRRNLGAHYTSEKNILKVVHGLFLDDLLAEFDGFKNNLSKLRQFQDKLAGLRFFDPACGCGNFLVIAYREMRRLELSVLKQLRQLEGRTKGDRAYQGQLEARKLSKLSVDQYYGIEVEEFPAEIARVALWVTDHLANLELSAEFGIAQFELPLEHTPNIVHGNALRLDWRDVVGEPDASLYILGNPPFVGKDKRSAEQTADMAYSCSDVNNFKTLDYVAAWYIKGAKFLSNRVGSPHVKGNSDREALTYVRATDTRIAFVSTNSITQGEQVGILWSYLLERGIQIHLAHRTFKWTNEATGKAAVYCVIISFGSGDTKHKRLFDYSTPTAEPHGLTVKNINPYLVDAPNIVVMSRRAPISDVPEMIYGNKPVDGGNLFFNSRAELDEFLKRDPSTMRFVRRIYGSEEFINGIDRWCLWLKDVPPTEWRGYSAIIERVQAVRTMRLASNKTTTRSLADTPYLFAEIRQPASDFLLVPRVSSENRRYIPIGFLSRDVCVNDLVSIVPNARPYHFGVLTSMMHNAWMRQVCGRLKSDYRYSNNLVYNNFPWPNAPSEKQVHRIEQTVQGILDARAKFPGSTLAALYDSLTMPKDLVDAHRANDEAVDAAYGTRRFKNELERLEFLFDLYRKYTEPLGLVEQKKTKGRRRRTDK
jgi:hypothetical protein